MASEIEAKVRVGDEAAVLRAIAAAGAEPRGAWIETDAFFDHPDERLRKGDSALRLRRRRPLDEVARSASASGPAAVLTYKGPRVAGRMKVREELEVAVPDAEAMEGILRRLGYQQTFCYQKRRRKWRLEGAEVTLDEVPRLGMFVEVEAASEDEVDRLLDGLGFAGVERLTTSYLAMLVRTLGGAAGDRCVRFDDGGGVDSQ